VTTAVDVASISPASQNNGIGSWNHL